MDCAADMASCGLLYIPNLMKTGTGVQTILRITLRNLRDCNVGITNGRNL
jgi:hypothetical protein